MNRIVLIVGISITVLAGSGCSKKAPQEANKSLDAALGALPKDDTKTFCDHILTAQRDGVIKKEQWPFFQAVKSHKIDNEFDVNVTDTSATVSAVLYFDDKKDVHSPLAFVMQKEGDAWRIDLDATIKREIQTNGGNSFNQWKIVIKKK